MSNVLPTTVQAVQEAVDPCSKLLANDTMLSRLAYELAREVYPPADVIPMYGVTIEQFNTQIVNNPTFMTYYAEAHAIWHSSANTKERVSAKAGLVFEEWMREGNRLLHDPNSPMAAKVDLAKFLARIANFEPKEAKNEGPDRSVSVTINLGHARIAPREIVIEKTLDALPSEVTPVGAK